MGGQRRVSLPLTVGLWARATGALLVVAVVAGVVAPAGAAPGSTDPTQAPRICSQGTLSGDMTQAWQSRYVRLEIPQGATVTFSGEALVRSHGAIGFLAYWGLTTDQNPSGRLTERGTTYQFGGNYNPQWLTLPLATSLLSSDRSGHGQVPVRVWNADLNERRDPESR